MLIDRNQDLFAFHNKIFSSEKTNLLNLNTINLLA